MLTTNVWNVDHNILVDVFVLNVDVDHVQKSLNISKEIDNDNSWSNDPALPRTRWIKLRRKLPVESDLNKPVYF